MEDFSYVTNSHPAYIESIYNDYLKNPGSVDPELQKFFEGFDFALLKGDGKAGKTAAANGNGTTLMPAELQAEINVFELIRCYRKRGHLIATTNPIRPRKDRKAYLDLASFNLGEADMDTRFYAGKYIGLPNGTLREIYTKLVKIYASTLFM
jgi:2-oxoglutarate dehydrogenase E1 component